MIKKKVKEESVKCEKCGYLQCACDKKVIVEIPAETEETKEECPKCLQKDCVCIKTKTIEVLKEKYVEKTKERVLEWMRKGYKASDPPKDAYNYILGSKTYDENLKTIINPNAPQVRQDMLNKIRDGKYVYMSRMVKEEVEVIPGFDV